MVCMATVSKRFDDSSMKRATITLSVMRVSQPTQFVAGAMLNRGGENYRPRRWAEIIGPPLPRCPPATPCEHCCGESELIHTVIQI